MKLFSWPTYRNARYKVSRLAVVFFVVIVAVYIYLQLSLFLTQSQIAKQLKCDEIVRNDLLVSKYLTYQTFCL